MRGCSVCVGGQVVQTPARNTRIERVDHIHLRGVRLCGIQVRTWGLSSRRVSGGNGARHDGSLGSLGNNLCLCGSFCSVIIPTVVTKSRQFYHGPRKKTHPLVYNVAYTGRYSATPSPGHGGFAFGDGGVSKGAHGKAGMGAAHGTLAAARTRVPAAKVGPSSVGRANVGLAHRLVPRLRHVQARVHIYREWVGMPVSWP